MHPNFFNDLSAPLPTSSDLQLFSCSLNFSHLFSPLLTSSHLFSPLSPLLTSSPHLISLNSCLTPSRLASAFLTFSHILSILSCLSAAQLFAQALDFSRLISTLFSPLLVLPQLLSTFRARSQLLSPHFNSFLTPSRLVSALLNF